MDLNQTLNYLYSLTTKGIKLGLNRVLKFLDMLNNPQNNFKSIHIAGTNGKGTVAHLLYSVLKSSGLCTGLYTSPHLMRFNERIIVNDIQIPDEFIYNFVKKHRPILKKELLVHQ